MEPKTQPKAWPNVGAKSKEMGVRDVLKTHLAPLASLQVCKAVRVMQRWGGWFCLSRQ